MAAGGGASSSRSRRVSILDDYQRSRFGAPGQQSQGLVRQMRSNSIILEDAPKAAGAEGTTAGGASSSGKIGGGSTTRVPLDDELTKDKLKGTRTHHDDEFFCEPVPGTSSQTFAQANPEEDIIVLPLFEGGANLWGRRQSQEGAGGLETVMFTARCNCRDGIHTCMSPRTTQATTALGTALPSTGASVLQSQHVSRRGSDWHNARSSVLFDKASPENELHISVLKMGPGGPLMHPAAVPMESPLGRKKVYLVSS
ncbi:unnamed protein product, partial [Amoebophrya sp. A25]|eukprot:GSA25T00006507001.1